MCMCLPKGGMSLTDFYLLKKYTTFFVFVVCNPYYNVWPSQLRKNSSLLAYEYMKGATPIRLVVETDPLSNRDSGRTC